MSNLKTKNNQSMLDIILTATGTMESAIGFCAANNVSITDIPVVTTLFSSTDDMDIDNETVTYLSQRNITIGTLNNI